MSDDLFNIVEPGVKGGVVNPDDPQGELGATNPELEKWMSKDLETVAKAKVNSDKYILQLQGELEGMRQQLTVSTTLEEFMEKQDRLHTQEQTDARAIAATAQLELDPVNAPGNQTNDNAVDLTNEVQKTLTKELDAREASRQKDVNLTFVKEKATEALGPEYPILFKKKAMELGLDEDYLESMAMTQPKAFLELMLRGQDYAPATSGAAPLGGTTSQEGREALAQSGMGRQGAHITDWDHLKENPSDYWSPRIQNEIFKAALEAEAKGQDFYSRK